nr:hypothetical protein [Spirochaetota bacterium]
EVYKEVLEKDDLKPKVEPQRRNEQPNNPWRQDAPPYERQPYPQQDYPSFPNYPPPPPYCPPPQNYPQNGENFDRLSREIDNVKDALSDILDKLNNSAPQKSEDLNNVKKSLDKEASPEEHKEIEDILNDLDKEIEKSLEKMNENEDGGENSQEIVEDVEKSENFDEEDNSVAEDSEKSLEQENSSENEENKKDEFEGLEDFEDAENLENLANDILSDDIKEVMENLDEDFDEENSLGGLEDFGENDDITLTEIPDNDLGENGEDFNYISEEEQSLLPEGLEEFELDTDTGESLDDESSLSELEPYDDIKVTEEIDDYYDNPETGVTNFEESADEKETLVTEESDIDDMDFELPAPEETSFANENIFPEESLSPLEEAEDFSEELLESDALENDIEESDLIPRPLSDIDDDLYNNENIADLEENFDLEEIEDFSEDVNFSNEVSDNSEELIEGINEKQSTEDFLPIIDENDDYSEDGDELNFDEEYLPPLEEVKDFSEELLEPDALENDIEESDLIPRPLSDIDDDLYNNENIADLEENFDLEDDFSDIDEEISTLLENVEYNGDIPDFSEDFNIDALASDEEISSNLYDVFDPETSFNDASDEKIENEQIPLKNIESLSEYETPLDYPEESPQNYNSFSMIDSFPPIEDDLSENVEVEQKKIKIETKVINGIEIDVFN